MNVDTECIKCVLEKHILHINHIKLFQFIESLHYHRYQVTRQLENFRQLLSTTHHTGRKLP